MKGCGLDVWKQFPKFLSLSGHPGIGQLHCWQGYFLLYFVKNKIICLDWRLHSAMDTPLASCRWWLLVGYTASQDHLSCSTSGPEPCAHLHPLSIHQSRLKDCPHFHSLVFVQLKHLLRQLSAMWFPTWEVRAILPTVFVVPWWQVAYVLTCTSIPLCFSLINCIFRAQLGTEVFLQNVYQATAKISVMMIANIS